MDLEDNEIDSLRIYSYLSTQHIDCRHNRLTFNNLPDYARASIYEYAPQANIQIPSQLKSGTVDLSRENVKRWGKFTSTTGTRALPTYTWYRANGTPVPAEAYSVTDGVTTFAANFVDSAYCVISNPNFPDLTGDNALRTTTALIGDATGINTSLQNGCTVTGSHRHISITGMARGTNVTISTPGGSTVKRHKIANSNDGVTYSVAPGIYVVRCTGEAGTTSKTVAVNE